MQLFGDKCYSGIQWRWNCKALCGFLHRFPIFQCSGVVGRALGQKSEVLGLVPGFATFQLCGIALMDSTTPGSRSSHSQNKLERCFLPPSSGQDPILFILNAPSASRNVELRK